MTLRPRLFEKRQRDLDEEIQSHLGIAIQDRINRGESPQTARQSTLRDFGNVMLVKDVTREHWGWLRSGRLRQDLHYAFRQFRKNPGFAATAILMLALGIGANAAVFSVFHQVVLRSLPVRSPKELILLSEKSAVEEGSLSSWGDNAFYFSYPAYLSMRDGAHTLEGLAASALDWVNLAAGDSADKVVTEFVSGNYFNVLGIRPLFGRIIIPTDDLYHNGNPVAVLGEAYWRTHFGSDPAILNRIVRVNGELFTIVGVVRYGGLSGQFVPALFVPMALQHQIIPGSDRLPDELYRWVTLVGRLKPGVSQRQAEGELNRIWLNWRKAVLTKMHRSNAFDKQWMQTHLSLGDGAGGLPFLESLLGDPLKVLLWMVIAVLAIGCGNIANLLLVKVARRQRELALQGALVDCPGDNVSDCNWSKEHGTVWQHALSFQ